MLSFCCTQSGIKRDWMMDDRKLIDLKHLAEVNETIPDSVALLSRDDLTESELRHAKEVEKRAQAWLDRKKMTVKVNHG
jgi:hypothetical protein